MDVGMRFFVCLFPEPLRARLASHRRLAHKPNRFSQQRKSWLADIIEAPRLPWFSEPTPWNSLLAFHSSKVRPSKQCCAKLVFKLRILSVSFWIKPPKTNYSARLELRSEAGLDFFCRPWPLLISGCFLVDIISTLFLVCSFNVAAFRWTLNIEWGQSFILSYK